MGATCMVSLRCGWLHPWWVWVVGGCMHGEFELWVAICMVSLSCGCYMHGEFEVWVVACMVGLGCGWLHAW